MLLVIFGAGASYDSLPDFAAGSGASPPRTDLRPPLASELFQIRQPFAPWVDRYWQCSPLFPRLRRSDTHVEQELEKIRDEATTDPQRAVQLHAIRYYLKRIIWATCVDWPKLASGVTGYAHLLDRVRYWQARTKESLALVTFNYDTLLEDGCRRAFGIHFPSCDTYVKEERCRLFKLHGSINWVRFVEGDVNLSGQAADHGLISLGQALRLSPEYRQVGIGDDIVDGRPVYPAIAIPLETKSDFECPPDHIEILKTLLPSIDKVLVIGWRATEAHFLTLCSGRLSTSTRFQIVAGRTADAETVQQNLEGAGIRGAFQTSEHGFSPYLASDELEQFLG